LINKFLSGSFGDADVKDPIDNKANKDSKVFSNWIGRLGRLFHIGLEGCYISPQVVRYRVVTMYIEYFAL
jgi:hypothetical protein